MHHDPKAMDFLAFYTGGQLLKQSPVNLYNLNLQHVLQQHIDPTTQTDRVFLPFLNPPFVALFFQLLIPLGVVNAYAFFLGINITLLLLICFAFLQQNKKMKWYYSLAFILGALTFVPILITLLVGQLSIFLCVIFLLSWLFLKKGWEFRSGLVLACILIKPHFFLLPFLAVLVQRRRRQVAGFTTGILFFIAVSYIAVGDKGMNSYISLMSVLFTTGTGYNINLMAQQSLQTMLLIIFHTHSLTQIRLVWAIASLCIAIPTLYVWAKRLPLSSPYLSLQFALLIVATLVISPHTHFYDVSVLLVVTILLLSVRNVFKNKQKKLFIFLSILNYCVPALGYCLFALSQNESQVVWILPTSMYLIFFWIILLRVILQGKIISAKLEKGDIKDGANDIYHKE